MRRAKIVATLGPALDDPDRLRAVIAGGVDVVRLNFSHGTAEEHADRLEMVHTIAAQLGRNVGSLGDLQGPKIRLGVVPADGILLPDGGEVILRAGHDELDDYDDGAGIPVLPVVYEQLADDVEPGALILINDGMIRLVVSRVHGDAVHTRVVAGGIASSRKGVNLPGVDVSAKAMTDKDRIDLKTMCEIGVDWIAMSFVRTAAEVVEVRRLVHLHGGEMPVIAKLERPEAITNLESIIAESDAVMVARGDLGVEIGPERVPAIQKQIITMANQAGKPVITATEMLDSMIRSPRPTRAEASDVANAIFDGTDAVMLSGETAAGRFPVEAVNTMARIIEVAESTGEHHTRPPEPKAGLAVNRVVAKAAVQAAKDIRASAICVFSLSGHSAQLVSKFRPDVPIIACSTREAPRRRTALMWGTEGVLVPEKTRAADLIAAAEEVVLSRGLGAAGDSIVIVSGVPGRGGTNRLMLHTLGGALE